MQRLSGACRKIREVVVMLMVSNSLSLDTVRHETSDGTIGGHPVGFDGSEVSTQGSR